MTALFWSSGGILLKWIPWFPMHVAAVRSTVAVLVIFSFMRLRHIRVRVTRYTLLAAVGVCGCSFLFVLANKLTTAANAVVLQYMNPVFVLLFSALFLKKKLKKSDVLIVAAVLGGMVLFFFDELSPEGVLGNVLAILSGVFMAVMFLSLERFGGIDDYRYSGILLGQSLCALIGYIGFFLVPFEPQPKEFGLAVLCGVVQMGIPYVCYGLAAKTCPALACSLLGMLEPLLNPVWVFFLAGEAPGFFALLGACVVLLSLSCWFLYENRQLKREAEAAERGSSPAPEGRPRDLS